MSLVPKELRSHLTRTATAKQSFATEKRSQGPSLEPDPSRRPMCNRWHVGRRKQR